MSGSAPDREEQDASSFSEAARDTNLKPGVAIPCEAAKKTSQRKDTKDSGYGGCSSECEEELQLLPDWCYQYLQRTDVNNEVLCKDVDDKKTFACEFECKDRGTAFGSKQNTSKVQIAWMTQNEERGLESDECRSKVDSNVGVAPQGKVFTEAASEVKPNKRHRRMTPVPLSNPVKICLASRPDCLFVEEEDTEDLNDFNTDDDFVYQGLPQLSSSPRGSPKQLQRTIKYKAAFQKMDGKEESEVSKTSPRRLSEEEIGTEGTPEAARSHEEALFEKSSGANADSNSPEPTPELPRLYLRSRSENDACLYTHRAARKNQLARIESEGEGYFRDRVGNKFSGASKSELNSKGRMSTGDIPQIELEPAASLPDWMKEAKGEQTSADCSTTDTVADEKKEDSSDTGSQIEPSVKMRNKEPRSSWRSKKQTEAVDEDVIKIYTPKKHYEGQKPKRSRKLTPARATSPSLEKLADLQSQVFAFTLAENDSD